MGLKYHLTAEQRASLARDGIVRTTSGAVVTQAEVDRDDEAERLNTEARRRYLAGLEEQRAAERRREEERIDTLLAPRKDLERHRWLADHPDRTPNDFERIWREHLRPVAVAELGDEATRQIRDRMAASAVYGL